MRPSARFICILMFVPALASAQSSGGPGESEAKQRDDLVRIEREIAQANFDCNYSYFARVEGAEAVFTDPSGTVTDRAGDLAGEATCHKTNAMATLDSVEIRLYGPAAVVLVRLTIAATSRDGKPVTRRSRFTDVFVWRDNRWQLVAGHSSRLA